MQMSPGGAEAAASREPFNVPETSRESDSLAILLDAPFVAAGEGVLGPRPRRDNPRRETGIQTLSINFDAELTDPQTTIPGPRNSRKTSLSYLRRAV